MNSKIGKVLTRGIFVENPVFRLLLGMCPVLGVTILAENGLGMGLATAAVLILSNIVISSIRSFIPAKIRIPCYIVVIATFVTIADMLLNAYTPDLHARLGVFIPLIVVNCIILGRAEAFAGKNSVLYSAVDGLSMGVGFTLALTILASLREILGFGTFFGIPVMGESFQSILLLATPPGAFIALGFLLAGFNVLLKKLRLT